MFLLSPSAIVGTRRRRASRARFGARGWGGIVAASVLLGAPGQVGRAQQAGIPQVAPNALGVTIPDLRAADEAAVSGEWVKLQAELREAETLDPAAAIPLYGQFLDRGGARFDGVALSVVSRVGRLYWADLREFDKALEGYDWAIAAYPNAPDLPRIREERRAVEQEQARQTRRRANRESVPVPPLKIAAPVGGNVPGAAPLVAPITKVGGLPAVAQPVVPPLKFVMPDLAAPATRVVVPPLRLAALDLALPARPGTYAGWTPSEARAVTALARGAGGQVWAATEDAGVWRYDASAPAATRWKQFTAQDGVGDNSAYALATDKQGRMWAGTLNHGVSVWNGKTWRNYGVLEGPLGERVFDIAVCPTDGDVWIATNAGLTRYSVAKDSWSYVTRAEGLPSDQVQALAFDQSGNLVVGTQCEGVAIALAAEGYKNWRVVTGPERMPLTPTGAGLPSNLINDVMVARDGTYYVATTTGLAWSGDAGRSWAFVRGRDYAAKVAGLYGGAPATWTEVVKPGALLAEDYVTSLAEDEQGLLWVGHWNKGSEVLEMRGAGGVKDVVWQEKSGFVKAILAGGGGPPLLVRYDEGIEQPLSLSASLPSASTQSQGAKTGVEAAFPFSAKPPTLEELQAILQKVGSLKGALRIGTGAYLGEDWRTQGDWVGRYGRRYAVLCATQSPASDIISVGPYFWADGEVGPHHNAGDELRSWIETASTKNSKSLYNPELGFRRLAEWDDHGEVYPLTYQGPDIYITVRVPEGVHRATLYFYNKDGHDGLNRIAHPE